MARILTPEQFRQCPKGTVFLFGSGDLDLCRSLLVLDAIIPVRDGGTYGGPPYWGFWAIDVVQSLLGCSEGTEDDIAAAREFGKALDFDPDRYWSYEDAMDVFLVFDRADWDLLNRLVTFHTASPKNA